MSVKVSSWVYDFQEVSGNDKFVLLSLADNAWDDGSNAWPSISTIKWKTGLGERTIQRCLRRLEELGVLETVLRPGHSNLYRIVMKQIPARQKPQYAQPKKDVVPHSSQDNLPELSEKRPVGRPKKVREPDEVWDTVMAVCGVNSETLNSQERGRHNKAVKAMKESGATQHEILKRAQLYVTKFPNAPLTPIALASHWSELDSSTQAVQVQQNQVPQGWNAIKQAREQRGA